MVEKQTDDPDATVETDEPDAAGTGKRDQAPRGRRARRRGRRRGRAIRRSTARRRAVEPDSAAEPGTAGQSNVLGSVAEALERARREIVEAAEPERAGIAEDGVDEPLGAAATAEAKLATLRLLEGTLVDAVAKLDRIQRAIDGGAIQERSGKGRSRRRRRARSDGRTRDRLPDGAVLVATRLASAGRSREEVRNFLKESFRGIDSSTVIELAFREQPHEA